jgi:hypothetical protein
MSHMGSFYGGHGHSMNPYALHNVHHHSYMPRQDPRYPPHHMPYMGISPYDGGQPHYPGYPSPYQFPSHPADSSLKKKRKLIDGNKKSSRNPKRKKMYSDFVGVTYNKTHAKFQACITHYRKQHYLGRYKLACDAAKAYDQSAKMLKGDTWKVNFQSEEEYQAARERELREVEDRRNLSGVDAENLRESFISNFPSDATLREKLGIKGKKSSVGDKQSHDDIVPSGTQSINNSRMQAPLASREQVPHQTSSVQSHRLASSGSTGLSGTHSEMTTKEISVSEEKSGDAIALENTNSNQSLTKSAVTPSPNVFNNFTKNTNTLMKEPLMSPPFKMGSSPSAHSLLGGTPFSMPGSSVKFNSAAKGQTDNNLRDFGSVPSNIFQSPYMNELSLAKSDGTAASGRAENLSDAEEDSDEKGKGDLTAASALLMMNGN